MSTEVLTLSLAAVMLVLLIFLLKYLLCNRFDEDIPQIVFPRNPEAFWTEYERFRQQAIIANQPPPDFEEAVNNSQPVFVITVDEEQPPSYDEILKSDSSENSSTGDTKRKDNNCDATIYQEQFI